MPFDTDFYHNDWLKTIELAQAYHEPKYKEMEPLGGFSSHLATLFRVTKGTNIRLGVFGHIYTN